MGLTRDTSPTAAPVSLGEAKAFLRIGNSEEDALIAQLIRTASELCEAFTGLVLIERALTEVLPASDAWRRLSATPVRAIQSVLTIDDLESEAPLPAGAYAVDIDVNGDGWVRVSSSPAAGRVKVAFTAGVAADWNHVPEALRQGIVRLVAHLYTHRDGEEAKGPPFAVTALWRPWRRMRLQ